MLKLEVLVVELGAIDRLPTSSIASSEITSLDHELLDNSVEGRSLIRKGSASFCLPLLASTEGTKVLSCFGDNIIVQLEGDSSFSLVAN